MTQTVPSASPVRPVSSSAWVKVGWVAAAVATCIGLGVLTLSPPAADTPLSWSRLSPQEQAALQPLEGLWSTIDADRKQKWREVANRFGAMSLNEQQRIRERMVDWAKLSAAERGAARLGFEQSKSLPVSERQAGWEAYQALPEEQRKALASQAAAPKRGVAVPSALVDAGNKKRSDKALPATVVAASPGATQPKSNVVATTLIHGKPVAPTVVQATVGASTRPVNQRPAPPEHQRPGQPKIAAAPELIDRATLLPTRPATATPPPAVTAQTPPPLSTAVGASAPASTAAPAQPFYVGGD